MTNPYIIPRELQLIAALARRGEKQPGRTVQQLFEFQRNNNRAPTQAIPIYPDVKPSKHLVWESVADFVNYVKKIPGSSPTMSDQESRDSLLGWNSNDIIKLYDQGWTDGFKLVQNKFDDAIIAAQKALAEEDSMIRDVHGSIVDVPAFLSGDPENMYEFREETQEVLKLEVDVDYFFAGGGTQMYLERGAIIMAAVMALRRAGVFVTLYAREISRGSTWVSNYQDERHSCTIKLMGPDTPENLTETLIAVAHPSFNMPLFYQAQSLAWGCRAEKGICYQNRNFDDFIPKPGTGKISIPGVWTARYMPTNVDDLGIDWTNFWAAPEAAAVMVKAMFKSAALVVKP